jgi:hypothetical protein
MVYFSEKNSKDRQILAALGSRNGTELVKPFEQTTIFQPVKRCQNKGKDKLAIILVTTMPESTERRDSIRNGWANWNPEFDIMVFFFTGRPKEHAKMQALEDEVYLHGDLILEDLKEDYNSLTIKTLRMLKWFLAQCDQAKYFIKIDDDVFLNVPSMVSHLEEVSKSPTQYSTYIGGQVHRGREPHDVNPFSKWYIPSKVWPTGETLPPYAGGPCYVISGELVPKLYAKALTTPLINLEDVFLIGVVGYQGMGIEPKNIPKLYDAHYPRLNYHMSTDSEIQEITAYHTDGDVELMILLYKKIRAS